MSPEELAGYEALAGGVWGVVFAFWLGALFGSFGNVCIYRLPLELSISRPPSHCFACKAPIAWYDNVPILAYFWLRGRCRRCKAGYSPRYMLVEVATGALFAAAWWLCLNSLHPEEPLGMRLGRFAIYALFLFVLVVITFIDLDHKLIFDRITYPAIPLFYVLGLLTGDMAWWEGLLGAAVGYGVVWGFANLYRLIRKVDGMGYGDGKLLAVIGALLGWKGVVFGLFGGAILGTLIMVPALIVARLRQPPDRRSERQPTNEAKATSGDTRPKESESGESESEAGDGDAPGFGQIELPFGPFIAGATVAYLFLQEQILIRLAAFLLPEAG
jgi:leader peptidase (prepilin peptidase)/N-methyltransferase